MARAIQPAPAVMPSVHCGTRPRLRYAPPSPAQAPPKAMASVRTKITGDRARGSWKHDVGHRKGVPYKDRGTAERFGRQRDQTAAKARESFRGRTSSGSFSNRSRTGGESRIGNRGTTSRPSTSRPSTSRPTTRPSTSRGTGSSRLGNRSTPKRTTTRPSNRSSSRSRSAFGGSSRKRSSVGKSRSRGRSSLGSRRSSSRSRGGGRRRR